MAVTDDVGDMLLWPTYYSYLKMGCTKDKITDQTNLSQEQLRSITAQIVDRELLH